MFDKVQDGLSCFSDESKLAMIAYSLGCSTVRCHLQYYVSEIDTAFRVATPLYKATMVKAESPICMSYPMPR